MENNALFSKLLHLTGCGRDKDNLSRIFSMGGLEVSPSKIRSWRITKEKDKYGKATHMTDHALNCFIHGLFEYRNEQQAKGVNVFNFPKPVKREE